MNIYLESVNLDEIRNAASAGLADGVAFSHVAFSADTPDASAKERLEEISREFAFPICVPVGAVTSANIYTEARELAKISDHVVVQIPLVEDSLIPMSKLSAEGVVICATFAQTLATIKNALDVGGEECDVMAASPGSAVQFADCATAGVDIVCLDPQTLRGLVVHPLSDRGIDRFLSDLAKRPKSRGST
jgi:transaldolase